MTNWSEANGSQECEGGGGTGREGGEKMLTWTVGKWEGGRGYGGGDGFTEGWEGML